MHQAKCVRMPTFFYRRCGRSTCLSSDSSPVGLAFDMDRLFSDLHVFSRVSTRAICLCVGLLVVPGWTSVAGASCGHYVVWGEHSYTSPLGRQPAPRIRHERIRGVGHKQANWIASADVGAHGTGSTSKSAARWGANPPLSGQPTCSGPSCQQRDLGSPIEPITVSNSSLELFAWFQSGEALFVDAFFSPLALGQATPIRELLARVERPPRS
jgi:hypothetical protein